MTDDQGVRQRLHEAIQQTNDVPDAARGLLHEKLASMNSQDVAANLEEDE